MRLPGIEPGSSGWKPDILTTIPKALVKTEDIEKKIPSGIEKKLISCILLMIKKKLSHSYFVI